MLNELEALEKLYEQAQWSGIVDCCKKEYELIKTMLEKYNKIEDILSLNYSCQEIGLKIIKLFKGVNNNA